MAELIALAASLYDTPNTRLEPMRGGHVNQVFEFSKDGREYVLRLSPPGQEMDLPHQMSMLAWIAFLAEHGANVPTPLPSKNGNLIETIKHGDEIWHAVAYSKAEGVLSEELSLEQWDARLYQSLGRTVGKMHRIACMYSPPPKLQWPEWNNGGNLYSKALDPGLPWLEDKRSTILERMNSLPQTPDAYGMIHADLHFGNFFINEKSGKITLIDFDDCCRGWYTMDLALLLFDILVLYPGPDRKAFAEGFLHDMLSGYAQEKALLPSWLLQLPLFLKLLEINIYSRVHRAYETGHSDWWIDKFMPGRLERIQKGTPYISLDWENIIP